MSAGNRSLLGSLLFVGAAQFVFALVVAEALYPGYTIAANYISDLGVGSAALLFGASVVLLGVTRFFGAVFGRQTLGTLLTVTLALGGLGSVGVGLFPETTGAYHGYFSIVTFFFGAVTVILSYRVTHRPFSYFSVVLGIIALVAFVLSFTHNNLDIGRGGMERLIAYPLLVWSLAFGGYMMGSK